MQGNTKTGAGIREQGQALLLMMLTMPVLLGFLGLSIDYGRLTVQQRTLQNQADAAALAGGANLSKYADSACTDASTSLTVNNSAASATCNVSTTTYTNDTITVTLSQSVPLDFFPVLGVNTKTLTATAKVRAQSITGCNDSNVGICAPYAAWQPGAACSGNYTAFEPGQLVIIRSSQGSGWVNGTPGSVGTGAGGCNNAWTVPANDFKGFLRPTSGSFQTGNNLITKGGNACGQEPVSDMQAAFTAHQTLIIPVLDAGQAGQGNGNPQVHIPYFITIRLDFTYPYANQVQAISFNGSPTGGKYKLTYGGQQTAQIDAGASAATVQSALAALSNIGQPNVAVASNTDGSYTVTFQGTFATSTNIGLLTSSDSNVVITTTYADTSKSGTASAVGDYTCPQTWFAKVVDESTTAGGGAGITQTGQCNSTAYTCSIVLSQ